MPPATNNDPVLLVMREIDRRRRVGLIGLTESVSIKTMSEISAEIGSPVSERTFRRIEQSGLAKFKHHPLARLALQHFTGRHTC